MPKNVANLSAAAIVVTVVAGAAPALACQPITFSDVAGRDHQVEVAARNCAEVTNYIRGYANSAVVTASGLSRVLAAQFGAYGQVRVVAFGDAQVGVYQRNGGSVDILTRGGEISARVDGGKARVRNSGPNMIIVSTQR